MKFIVSCVLLSLLTRSAFSASLAQLHVVFRHGERAPTSTFPNDPYINYSWPNGWGQLTNRGKLQIFQLGQRIRNEYSNFIPKTYWHKDVNVSSSYSDRCLASAELFGAGLFPPVGPQIWNEDLLWQPLPVYYTPRSGDKHIVMKSACPKYDKIFKEERSSPAILEIENKYKDLKEYLANHTGMKVKNIEDIESISNTLEIEKLHNFSLPSWTNESLMQTMKELGARNLAFYSETDYMKRIKGGMFLKNMLGLMDNNLSKLFLYSAHDLTLVHILRSLELIDVLKPDFGAALIFELYSDGEIKINYRNAWDGVSEIMSSKCSTPCNIEHFKESYKNFLPLDYNKECQLDND
ncbi:unnamed protein product [Phyllotreta striolata]|uniref:Uncharacterized protein n=1 Tax=Phyllotreta striolata TaxID=444603 RepID=A0A9N9TJW3_PHYSR|nr:unnamed protein product [Phyllotreta striolata]